MGNPPFEFCHICTIKGTEADVDDGRLRAREIESKIYFPGPQAESSSRNIKTMPYANADDVAIKVPVNVLVDKAVLSKTVCTGCPVIDGDCEGVAVEDIVVV